MTRRLAGASGGGVVRLLQPLLQRRRESGEAAQRADVDRHLPDLAVAVEPEQVDPVVAVPCAGGERERRRVGRLEPWLPLRDARAAAARLGSDP